MIQIYFWEQYMSHYTNVGTPQLQQAIYNTPVAIAFFDNNMNYIAYSKKWLEDYYLDANTSLIGKNHYEVFPEIKKEIRDVHQKCLSGETLIGKKYKFIRLDGSYKYVDWESKPWCLDNGTVGGVVVTTVDVTKDVENIELQNQVNNERVKYKSILELATDGIHIVDMDGKFLEFSDSYASMLGYSKEELLTLTIFDIDKNLSPFEIRGLMEMSIHNSLLFESKQTRKDGVSLDIQISARSIVIDSTRYIYASARDITEKKKQEQELQKQRDEFEGIFKTSIDGIAIMDLDSNFLDCNDAYLELTGLSKEQMLQRSCIGMTLPEDVERTKKAIAKTIADGFVKNFEKSCLLKEEKISVNISLTLMPDKKRILAVSKDMTEQKELQEALMQERDKLEYRKQILNDYVSASSDFVWEINEAGVFTYASKGVKEILGFEPQDIIGKSPFDLMPQEEAKRISEKVYDTIDNREIIKELVNANISASGETVWILTNGVPFYDKDNVFMGYRGTNKNITYQKMQEETLYKLVKEQEAFLRFKTASLFRAKNRKFTWVSDEMCNILGFSRDELIGQEASMLYENKDEYFSNGKIMSAAFEKGDACEIEFKAKRKDGSLLHILVGFTPIDGYPNEAIGLAIDITKQKLYEDHLQELVNKETIKRLEQERIMLQQSKMAMMGEMIGAIGHQWRQPLNSLAIKVQDAYLCYALGEADEAYMSEFKNDVMGIIKKMSSTIDDFRNFFRPVKDKTDFSLEDAINGTLGIIYVQLKNKGIEVVINKSDKDSEAHTVYGYQNEMEQCILIILSNAQDALVENKVTNPKIAVTLSHTDENKIVLSIQDNAGGIPDHVLDRIFEPYFTTKEQGEGTGIGLYIAKEIIERQMGGKLSVKNVDGGARFEIYI